MARTAADVAERHLEVPLPGMPPRRPRSVDEEVAAVFADRDCLMRLGEARLHDVEPFEPGTVVITTDLLHRLVAARCRLEER